MLALDFAKLHGWQSKIRLKTSSSAPSTSKHNNFDSSIFSVKLEPEPFEKLVEVKTEPLWNDERAEVEKWNERQKLMCVECRIKRIYAKQKCKTCYRRAMRHSNKDDNSRHRRCKVCKELKANYAHGMCSTCYRRKNYKTMNRNDQKKCKECEKAGLELNMGICHPCYCNKIYQLNETNNQKMCSECEQLKPIYARGVCRPCYHQIFEKAKRLDKKTHKKCRVCKLKKSIIAHGMCDTCYYREKYWKDRFDTAKHKECQQCKQIKLIEAHGMCGACYQHTYRLPKITEKKRLLKEQTEHLNCA